MAQVTARKRSKKPAAKKPDTPKMASTLGWLNDAIKGAETVVSKAAAVLVVLSAKIEELGISKAIDGAANYNAIKAMIVEACKVLGVAQGKGTQQLWRNLPHPERKAWSNMEACITHLLTTLGAVPIFDPQGREKHAYMTLRNNVRPEKAAPKKKGDKVETRKQLLAKITTAENTIGEQKRQNEVLEESLNSERMTVARLKAYIAVLESALETAGIEYPKENVA